LAWKEAANIKYNSKKETRKYQSIVKKNKEWGKEEQDWVDKFLAPLIDFMGDEVVWKYIVPGIILRGVEEGRERASARAATARTPENLQYPLAIFTGRHWLAYKKNDKTEFDPYNEYQIYGTNQFCQTFSMMYLRDKLPVPEQDPDEWKKFYVYTEKALEFIKEVINEVNKKISFDKSLNKKTAKELKEKLKLEELLIYVDECLTHPNICVNAIELP
jgi:hypothetical protein